jgi:hypothetical protein
MDDSEVTFVVQGPIVVKDDLNLTAVALNSIRTNFPDSRVILSTHHDQKVNGLSFDEVIFSERPPIELYENDKNKTLMSVNHQILTTKSGLAAVTTPYVIKTRTDIYFKNRSVFKLLDARPERIPTDNLTLTKELVLVINWSTVHPGKFLRLPHHPSDQLFAGLLMDVKRIWDAPSYPAEYMRWFASRDYPLNSQHGGNLQRYRSESWIWFNYVKDKVNFSFESSYDMSSDSMLESLNLLSHNLMVVSPRMMGVTSLKNRKPGWKSRVKMMTYWDWVSLSRNAQVIQKNVAFDFDSLFVAMLRPLISFLRMDKFIFDKRIKSFIAKTH